MGDGSEEAGCSPACGRSVPYLRGASASCPRLLAAAEPDAGANRGVDKAPPSQGRRRLSEHAARWPTGRRWSCCGRWLPESSSRRGDGEGDLASAWQMCDDGVAPARSIPQPVRVLGGPSAGVTFSAIRCRPDCYSVVGRQQESWTDHGDLLNELGSRSGPAGPSRDLVDHQGEADANHPGVLSQRDALLGGTQRTRFAHARGPQVQAEGAQGKGG